MNTLVRYVVGHCRKTSSVTPFVLTCTEDIEESSEWNKSPFGKQCVSQRSTSVFRERVREDPSGVVRTVGVGGGTGSPGYRGRSSFRWGSDMCVSSVPSPHYIRK